MRGDRAKAEQRLAAACQTNERAAGGFFLRGYLAWQQPDTARALELLTQARKTLGPDWQPKGATAEGDVKRKQHTETSPLARFLESWNGAPEPAQAYAQLDAHLKNRSY